MTENSETDSTVLTEKRKQTDDENENPTEKRLKNDSSSEQEELNKEKNPKWQNNDLSHLLEPAAKHFGKPVEEISKSMLKKYKKLLSWESSKKEKRKQEKLRAKQRKIEAKKNNIDLGPSRKQLKMCKMSSSPCKTSVIIDLSFDELMIPKDLGKVIKQILRVYTENRRSKAPMQLHLSSFDGLIKEEMSKHSGYENWDCHFHQQHYIELFPKHKLVYLTSESDNVIKELEEDKMYIIGGLVDHNAHKGLCYRKAVEQGIGHGQLPISEFFECKRRKVFTINQVFEILLRVSEGMSFKDAFERVLPQRINIVPTTQD